MFIIFSDTVSQGIRACWEILLHHIVIQIMYILIYSDINYHYPLVFKLWLSWSERSKAILLPAWHLGEGSYKVSCLYPFTSEALRIYHMVTLHWKRKISKGCHCHVV